MKPSSLFTGNNQEGEGGESSGFWPKAWCRENYWSHEWARSSNSALLVKLEKDVIGLLLWTIEHIVSQLCVQVNCSSWSSGKGRRRQTSSQPRKPTWRYHRYLVVLATCRRFINNQLQFRIVQYITLSLPKRQTWRNRRWYPCHLESTLC